MKKLLTYIKSLDFAFVICVISITGQSFHTFYAFYDVSIIKNDYIRMAEVVIPILAFESYTLFYLMRGRAHLAKFYSFSLLVMDIYYYVTNGATGSKLWMGIYISLIIPLSIYFVAEEVKSEYERQPENQEERLDEVEKLVRDLEKKVEAKTSTTGKIKF